MAGSNTIVDAATLAAAGAMLGGTVSAGFGGGQRTTRSSTSQLEFPQETRQLFQNVELPFLAGSLNEQANMFNPFYAGFGGRQFLQQQYGDRIQNSVLGAARKGAGMAGIKDLGPVYEGLQGLSPELLSALQNLVLQRGASVNSVVAPGYGSFLAPGQNTTSKGAEASPFDTGFGIAQGIAQLAGAYFGSGGF